jgi:hypothetical protein
VEPLIIRTAIAVFCLLVAASAPIGAQTGGMGAIAGTVRDQTGGPVPEAEVAARSVATNESRQVVTQSSGAFLSRAVEGLPLVTRFTQIIGLSPGISTDVTDAGALGRGTGGTSPVTKDVAAFCQRTLARRLRP